MTPIEQLRAEARAKRDKAISDARLEYRETMRHLATVSRRLADDVKPRYSLKSTAPPVSNEFARMTVVSAAETVLRELGPLTLVEIVVELQKRGCRTGDDPRAVGEAVRRGLRYHRDRFRSIDGNWCIIA